MRSYLQLGIFFLAIWSVASGQVSIPEPGPSRAVNIPSVKESTLPNGLKVGVVRKTGSPLVTIRLVISRGAGVEPFNKAGLADLTAAMLTKGTKTRTATQIAESVEFLGGSIASGAGWNGSFAAVTVTADKVPQAIAILSDVTLNPKFAADELELLKSQSLDGLTYNLKQPSFLAGYVASRYTFDEHPTAGTKASIESIGVSDVKEFYARVYRPGSAVLIFTGDIDAITASALAKRHFAKWKVSPGYGSGAGTGISVGKGQEPIFRRMLVIDLPNSGQAAVVYAKRLFPMQRASSNFFTASVFNSIFGGGYSSRLNTEIRIKRGLSYGAGSSFAWRPSAANFAASIQTKNESAAEVAELLLAELNRMVETEASNSELVPRKAVLTGGFGRNVETGSQMAAAIGDLHVFGLPTSDLNSYVGNINAVTEKQIRDFAAQNMRGGDIIIVGDSKIFLEDLKRRFPDKAVDVIPADSLDLSSHNLRK